MAGSRDRQYSGVRHWPLLGLLLVVSFLGHDLLMAASAAAEPTAAHHSSTLPAHGKSAAAQQRDGTPSNHPANCRIGQSAVPRSDDALGHGNPDLVAALGRVASIPAPGAHAGAFLREEPRWPPGTRRALFQVYRL